MTRQQMLETLLANLEQKRIRADKEVDTAYLNGDDTTTLEEVADSIRAQIREILAELSK